MEVEEEKIENIYEILLETREYKPHLLMCLRLNASLHFHYFHWKIRNIMLIHRNIHGTPFVFFDFFFRS